MELKLDVTYLKKLVLALDEQLALADSKKEPNATKPQLDYLVELNKATGVLVGLAQESKMLIGDIAQIVRTGGAQPPKNLQDLLGGLDGSDPFGGNFN